MVTDTISRFTPTGIQLDSGVHLDADIIVTATGLDLVTLGEIDFRVAGEPVDFSRTFTYKGVGYSGVPNLVSTFGFVNASWTLRADMVARYTARLLNHLSETGATTATPMLRMSDTDMRVRPYIEDFNAGYIERSLDSFPKQGDRAPWINPQNVRRTRKLLAGPVDDGVMRFETPRTAARQTVPTPPATTTASPATASPATE